MQLNLNSYDIVEQDFSKGTWVDPRFKRLYTTELEKLPIYSFLKRFNKRSNQYEYYLLFCDEVQEKMICHSTITNYKGITKIDIPDSIWNTSFLNNLTEKTFINAKLEEKLEGGIIYSLDI